MKFITRIAVMLTAAVLTVILFLAAGCRRSISEQSDDDSYYSGGSISLSPRGFAAVHNTPMYDLSSGKPEWIGAPDFGEILELNPAVLGEINPRRQVSYEPRETVIDDEYVYLIPVQWKNLSGWINLEHYAPEGSPVGVVTDAVIILRNDELLRRGDLAVFSASEKGFMLTPFYTRAGNEVIQKQISFKPEDVQAAKLLAKARADRNSQRSQALLKEAAEQYPSSVLFPMITEMINTRTERAETATESLAAFFSIEGESTAVYAAPDFSSAVVKRLEQYIDVKTTERTTALGTSSTGSARWYHISEPIDGWIFGLDLEGAD